MKNIFLTILILLLSFSLFSQINPNHHYVSGYYRSNGTYVQGYYRTNPNYTNRDNYSTKPNINPYTGEKGYIEPDNKNIPTTNFNNFHEITNLPSTTNLSSTPTTLSNSSSSNYLDEQVKRISKEEMKNQTMQKILNKNFSFNDSSILDALEFNNKYSFEKREMIELGLQALGYYIGIADGIFNYNTINGIKEFQKNFDIKDDGKVGQNTLSKLYQTLDRTRK